MVEANERSSSLNQVSHKCLDEFGSNRKIDKVSDESSIGIASALIASTARQSCLLVWTGLPGSSPQSHVFDMILEGPRRSRAARAGLPRPRNKSA
jgi:hypothetical protein